MGGFGGGGYGGGGPGFGGGYEAGWGGGNKTNLLSIQMLINVKQVMEVGAAETKATVKAATAKAVTAKVATDKVATVKAATVKAATIKEDGKVAWMEVKAGTVSARAATVTALDTEALAEAALEAGVEEVQCDKTPAEVEVRALRRRECSHPSCSGGYRNAPYGGGAGGGGGRGRGGGGGGGRGGGRGRGGSSRGGARGGF